MQLICSFCRKDLGRKAPFDDDRLTHGSCEECAEWFHRREEIDTFDDYLEQFESPVLLINDQGRVVAANNLACRLLGKPPERLYGLLGGEAMECIYARLPEGCGRTAHCYACTIRNLVEETMQEQRGLPARQVYLSTDEGLVEMLVQTRYEGGLVQVVVEDVL